MTENKRLNKCRDCKHYHLNIGRYNDIDEYCDIFIDFPINDCSDYEMELRE